MLTLDTRAVRGTHALHLRFETEQHVQFEQLAFL